MSSSLFSCNASALESDDILAEALFHIQKENVVVRSKLIKSVPFRKHFFNVKIIRRLQIMKKNRKYCKCSAFLEKEPESLSRVNGLFSELTWNINSDPIPTNTV